MSELVPHEHLVAVEDVLRRWHIEPWRLDEITRSAKILLFAIMESRINPSSGATVHFCSGPFSGIYSHDGYYEYENLFIPLEDVAAYEKAHPEVLWEPAVSEQTLKRESQELTEECGEYIPADVIRKKMRMSPIQFIDFMNHGKGPVTSKEESFRKWKNDLYADEPFFSVDSMSDFSVHILDWEAWRREHPDMMQETPAREDSPAAGADDGRLPAALREKDDRITDLETALVAKDAEFEQARAEMSALREEVAALKAKLEQVRAALEEARRGQEAATLEGHGLCSLVITMRREGKTEEEIAAFLSDAGKWCSAAQIGALLYLKEGRVSKDAMQKHGQRLLGTA